MKAAILGFVIACTVACADDLTQDNSRHADEARLANATESMGVYSDVVNRIASALDDLRTYAKREGGTSAERYTFFGMTRCGNNGQYSGGGRLRYADIDFQGQFIDCQDRNAGTSLDGRFRYELTVTSTDRYTEVYTTDMTVGLTSDADGDADDIESYLDCQSRLTVTTDGDSVSGQGVFCGVEVDDSWSFRA